MDARAFLLLLLDAARGTIESETRVQKLAFLGIKEEGLAAFTRFRWDKYGPLSKELWATLQKMKRQGLLRINEETRSSFMGDRYKIRVFILTAEGMDEASKLRAIHGDEFSLIKELYAMYGRESLDSLVNYVHKAYSPADL